MTIRPTTTIGVQPNTRLLRIERVGPHPPRQSVWHDSANRAAARMLGEEHNPYGAWMIWINANINFTLGTYIKLNDDGSIERVTVLTDGTEDVFVIKKRGD